MKLIQPKAKWCIYCPSGQSSQFAMKPTWPKYNIMKSCDQSRDKSNQIGTISDHY